MTKPADEKARALVCWCSPLDYHHTECDRLTKLFTAALVAERREEREWLRETVQLLIERDEIGWNRALACVILAIQDRDKALAAKEEKP